MPVKLPVFDPVYDEAQPYRGNNRLERFIYFYQPRVEPGDSSKGDRWLEALADALNDAVDIVAPGATDYFEA